MRHEITTLIRCDSVSVTMYVRVHQSLVYWRVRSVYVRLRQVSLVVCRLGGGEGDRVSSLFSSRLVNQIFEMDKPIYKYPHPIRYSKYAHPLTYC